MVDYGLEVAIFFVIRNSRPSTNQTKRSAELAAVELFDVRCRLLRINMDRIHPVRANGFYVLFKHIADNRIDDHDHCDDDGDGSSCFSSVPGRSPVCQLSSWAHGLIPSTYITGADKDRLKSVFQSASPFVDSQSAHFSILGLKLLGVTTPNAQDACKILSKVVENKVVSIYHASEAAKALGSCKIDVPEFKQTLTDAIKDDSSVQDIAFAFLALKNLGLPADDAAVSKALLAALLSQPTMLLSARLYWQR
ncbi:hypothetical protein EGW08_003369 [Elysia chlorotica]|uniref:Dolichyl-diphosphooligosaccharide--protein glycosyltransferase subunit 2 n=1 Tax=Elysia chlorotica TaxID=188477 RepID=A0A433U575_ELYCH|nr:hypothetical protein EGW08_003369 [Elysia chlorotica]